MTKRPLNECTDCGYTWHPRGKDVSRQCPSCGSRAVRISPWPALIVLGGVVGMAALAGCFCCAGLVGSVLGPKGSPDRPVVKHDFKEEKSPNEPPAAGLPSAPVEPAPVPVVPPVKVSPDRKKEPIRETVEPKSVTVRPAPPENAPPVLAPAPPPRLLPPTGFASRWDLCGSIQTRVVGATVFRPILIVNDSEESRAPEPLLVIWVETRSLPDGRASLRRWQSTFNEVATLTGADKIKIAPAKLPAGAWLGGQLKGDHSLKPGGAGVIDVLAFKIPPASAGKLWLELKASHVHESGTFLHAIPAEIWSRK